MKSKEQIQAEVLEFQQTEDSKMKKSFRESRPNGSIVRGFGDVNTGAALGQVKGVLG